MTILKAERPTVSRALAKVFSARQLADVWEVVRAERPAAAAADVLHWMRLHMPVAAWRVESLTRPSPRED